MDRSCSGSVRAKQILQAIPYVLGGTVRTQNRNADGYAASLATAQSLQEGFSEEDPDPRTPGRPEPALPLMMSASSSGSFQSSLYLLAVSMTLAAVYLWGARRVLWPGQGCGAQGRTTAPHCPAP